MHGILGKNDGSGLVSLVMTLVRARGRSSAAGQLPDFGTYLEVLGGRR